MYVRVLQDELQFPDDRAMDQDTKGLIRGVSGCVKPEVMVTDDPFVAVTTQPCTPYQRTTNKAPSLFLDDVCVRVHLRGIY